MNQEEIMKALEICSDSCGNCEDCPLVVLPGGVPNCMSKLILEARDLILSMIKPVKNGEAKQEPWTRKRVLSEAEKCVCGQREKDYGTPEDNFGRIAEFWTTYMGVEFGTVDVAIMMALLKIARISENLQHMDSWVDLAGYAACGGEIAGKDGTK